MDEIQGRNGRHVEEGGSGRVLGAQLGRIGYVSEQPGFRREALEALNRLESWLGDKIGCVTTALTAEETNGMARW